MFIRKREVPILAANLAYIVVFGTMSVTRMNYEFIIYALVIIVCLGLVLAFQRKLEFGGGILWGLTLWGFLHMAGGHVFIAGTRLYDIILVPISQKYEILKYDQPVHAFGFGVATLVCYHLLRPSLVERPRSRALPALVILMGMGVGALNEILELAVVLLAPQSGVGGYLNTAFDLLFNMLGAVVAGVWIALRHRGASC